MLKVFYLLSGDSTTRTLTCMVLLSIFVALILFALYNRILHNKKATWKSWLVIAGVQLFYVVSNTVSSQQISAMISTTALEVTWASAYTELLQVTTVLSIGSVPLFILVYMFTNMKAAYIKHRRAARRRYTE